MDFTITEEQQDIQNLANQILSENVTADTLQQYDSRETTRFDKNLWSMLAESGLDFITAQGFTEAAQKAVAAAA